MNEGTLFWRCGRDSVGLCHHFFEKDLRRHSSRGHAFAHLLDGLVEQAGKQFQSGDVILIVFYILEGENADQLRSVNVNSVELVYGHLPRLKARAFQVHLKIANHDLLVERFLFRKSGGVNRLEAVEKEPGLFQIVIDRFLREIVDFIVVALVAEDGGVERAGAHGVFPLLVEQVGERFAPGFEIGGWIGGGHGGRNQHGNS